MSFQEITPAMVAELQQPVPGPVPARSSQPPTGRTHAEYDTMLKKCSEGYNKPYNMYKTVSDRLATAEADKTRFEELVRTEAEQHNKAVREL